MQAGTAGDEEEDDEDDDDDGSGGEFASVKGGGGAKGKQGHHHHHGGIKKGRRKKKRTMPTPKVTKVLTRTLRRTGGLVFVPTNPFPGRSNKHNNPFSACVRACVVLVCLRCARVRGCVCVCLCALL